MAIVEVDADAKGTCLAYIKQIPYTIPTKFTGAAIALHSAEPDAHVFLLHTEHTPPKCLGGAMIIMAKAGFPEVDNRFEGMLGSDTF